MNHTERWQVLTAQDRNTKNALIKNIVRKKQTSVLYQFLQLTFLKHWEWKYYNFIHGNNDFFTSYIVMNDAI